MRTATIEPRPASEFLSAVTHLAIVHLGPDSFPAARWRLLGLAWAHHPIMVLHVMYNVKVNKIRAVSIQSNFNLC